MKNDSIGKHLGTDLKKLRALPDARIATDKDTPYNPYDPAAVADFWQNATVRLPGQRGKQKAPVKVATTIRFDADVLSGLKATGDGWQTRVNEAMRKWLKKQRGLST